MKAKALCGLAKNSARLDSGSPKVWYRLDRGASDIVVASVCSALSNVVTIVDEGFVTIVPSLIRTDLSCSVEINKT